MTDIKTIPMTFDELRATGLLWKVNHDLLHKMGLALGIEDVGDGAIKLFVYVSDDGLWEFLDEANKEKSLLFDTWYERLEIPQP